jgi:hypothetical protein
MPWQDDEARIAPMRFCSEDCVHRTLTTFLTGGEAYLYMRLVAAEGDSSGVRVM